MKQTVEEAARKYADENSWIPEELHDSEIPDYIEHFAKHFMAGAEWRAKQSPWISVKERLPEVDEEKISEQSEPVLVKISGHCEPEILVYNKYYHVWDTSDGDDYSCNISDDDLWMPIPSFDEILEANRDVLERIKEKGD